MPERVIGGTHVGWIVREPGPPPHFSLYDEDAQLLGRAQAPHGRAGPRAARASPGVYGKARENPAMADRVVQAYEPKQYFQGGRYIVIGSGIASVNEWANCIESGAQCIALRRNPHPDEQDLNVPRCLFDGSGIDAFQGLVVRAARRVPRAARCAAPRRTRRNWNEIITHGPQRRAATRRSSATITDIQPGPAGLKVQMRLYDGTEVPEIDVTGIVCGTGFVKSALALPGDPAAGADLQRAGAPRAHQAQDQLRRAAARPRRTRGCAQMGLDLEHGGAERRHDRRAEVPGRRFVGDCARAEDIKVRSFPSRLAMQMSLARQYGQGDPADAQDRAARVRGATDMCPTPIGRSTRASRRSSLGPALLGLIISLVTGPLGLARPGRASTCCWAPSSTRRLLRGS